MFISVFFSSCNASQSFFEVMKMYNIPRVRLECTSGPARGDTASHKAHDLHMNAEYVGKGLTFWHLRCSGLCLVHSV